VLYTYINELRGAVLIQKLAVAQLVKKFFTFYQTRGFIMVFTAARQQNLSEAEKHSPIEEGEVLSAYAMKV
jgi:hypothetical protein